jgi:hypothetical protein
MHVDSHLPPFVVSTKMFRNIHYSFTKETMYIRNVRFEVFMAVTMKKGVFWDVTPCGSCKNRRFGGIKWYWYFFAAYVGC